MHTSQEKADKWFHGGRFWQIPAESVEDEEELAEAFERFLKDLHLTASAIWAAEHSYIIYNPRRENIEIIPVFAAEVSGPADIPLTWEHSEYGWFTAEECEQRVRFRGLKEGLHWVQTYISEVPTPLNEIRIV